MKKDSSQTGYIPLNGISLEQAKEMSDALSDVLCWMDGFKAAGGTYSPGTLEKVRSLNIKLKESLP